MKLFCLELSLMGRMQGVKVLQGTLNQHENGSNYLISKHPTLLKPHSNNHMTANYHEYKMEYLTGKPTNSTKSSSKISIPRVRNCISENK